MKNSSLFKKILTALIIITLGYITNPLVNVSTIHAQGAASVVEDDEEETDYTLLTPLPAPGRTGETIDKVPRDNLSGYVRTLYLLLISLSGVAAVFMIIYGGIIYMTTDAIQKKYDGRKMIQHALWGLVIIMASYLILYTINPNILNVGDIIQESDNVD